MKSYVLIIQQKRKQYIKTNLNAKNKWSLIDIFSSQYSNIRSQCQQAQVVIMTER